MFQVFHYGNVAEMIPRCYAPNYFDRNHYFDRGAVRAHHLRHQIALPRMQARDDSLARCMLGREATDGTDLDGAHGNNYVV